MVSCGMNCIKWVRMACATVTASAEALADSKTDQIAVASMTARTGIMNIGITIINQRWLVIMTITAG